MPTGVYKRKKNVKKVTLKSEVPTGKTIIRAKYDKEKGWSTATESYDIVKHGMFPYEGISKDKRIELLLRDCLELKDRQKMSSEEYRINQDEIQTLRKQLNRYEQIIDHLTKGK